MEKKIIKAPNLKSKREITVIIEPTDIENFKEKVAKAYRKKAKVKGFRPGKAPLSVVGKLYEKEILEDAKDEAIRNKVLDKIKETGEEVVSQIYIKEKKENDDGSIEVVCEYDVMPVFDMPNLSKIKVEKTIKKVLDIDVDEEIDKIRKQFAKYIPIEEKAKEGLYLLVNYEDRLDGKLIKKQDKGLLYLKWDEMNPDLFELFVDKGKNDTVVFEQEVDIGDGKKGKLLRKYKILEVLKEELPELNDEFAKKLEFDSLEKLREEIAERLRKSNESKAEDDLEWRIIKEIYERINFELPESMVKNSYIFTLRSMGYEKEPEDDNLRQSIYNIAEDLVKREIILDRFSDIEGIEVGDEELKEEISKRAKEYNMPVKKYEEELKKRGELDSLKNVIRRRKAMDMIKKLVNVEVVLE